MLFFRCCSTGDLFLPFLRELNSLRIPWVLLFQVRQGGERKCHLIRLQGLQEPSFDLRIQGQRPHPLAVRSAKLALVSTTPILRKFALWARVVQMQESSTASTAHDPLQ
jgi:hypothetical protein